MVRVFVCVSLTDLLDVQFGILGLIDRKGLLDDDAQVSVYGPFKVVEVNRF